MLTIEHEKDMWLINDDGRLCATVYEDEVANTVFTTTMRGGPSITVYCSSIEGAEVDELGTTTVEITKDPRGYEDFVTVHTFWDCVIAQPY